MDWPKALGKKDIKEFSFFPSAYTPFEESEGTIPPVELEYDGGDDSEDQSGTPEWVKSLSFTIGGVTIGAAAVWGLWSTAPAPQCIVTTPLPAPTSQTTQTAPITHVSQPPPAAPASTSTSAGGAAQASASASSSPGAR